MNIWIVNHYAIPPSMGGLVRHYYFSKYLQQKKHQVKIFTSSKIHNTDINIIKDRTLYQEKVIDEVEYTFVKSRDYKGNGLDRIFNLMDLPFKTWKVMKKFLKKERADVIYTSSPDIFVAFFAVLFAKKNKIPVVTEVRDLWPESIVEYNGMSKRNLIIRLLYQLEKWVYKNSQQLIFTMQGGKDYIIDKGWDKFINLECVNYVNNGVDLKEFEENCSRFQLLDEDLISSEKFTIVYVGSIRKVNNLGALIDAAEYLKNEKDIMILIYGDGTEKKELEEKCLKNSLPVKFKGRVEKKYIPFILKNSDLNLINVKEAGINKYGCSWNKLFEYMASKKPILCNLPVAHDLISKYNLGIVKRYRDGKEYAQDIMHFANLSEDEYNTYCTNANKCVEKFDYKKLSGDIEAILFSALGIKGELI